MGQAWPSTLPCLLLQDYNRLRVGQLLRVRDWA